MTENMLDMYFMHLFAKDAVYHKECMTKYYTRHRSRLRKKHSEGKTSQSELEGIALAETVAYVIEDESDVYTPTERVQ